MSSLASAQEKKNADDIENMKKHHKAAMGKCRKRADLRSGIY